jgi:hypothetical protein
MTVQPVNVENQSVHRLMHITNGLMNSQRLNAFVLRQTGQIKVKL